ncbi:hypothetical protein E2C01_025187 [Portunus trituberculatus]|uniref:Uncharacterized protein n=1 Tax=Portunus trituberculatus TaxID=210409 RepID=A0A5B7EEJ8_PORTR|nr:hypothetical protein [Portunus trituberculatus]
MMEALLKVFIAEATILVGCQHTGFTTTFKHKGCLSYTLLSQESIGTPHKEYSIKGIDEVMVVTNGYSSGYLYSITETDTTPSTYWSDQ